MHAVPPNRSVAAVANRPAQAATVRILESLAPARELSRTGSKKTADSPELERAADLLLTNRPLLEYQT